MQSFFDKHKVSLDEGHALDHIIHKATKAKKLYSKDKDYDYCLKELSEMIDDFFRARDEV